jgi:hypothetical protein
LGWEVKAAVQTIHFSSYMGPFAMPLLIHCPGDPLVAPPRHQHPCALGLGYQRPLSPSQPGATTSIGRIRATLPFLSSPHRRVAKSYSTFLNARVLDPVNLLCVVLHSFSFGSEIEGRVLSFTARKHHSSFVESTTCAWTFVTAQYPRGLTKRYIYLGGNGRIRGFGKRDWIGIPSEPPKPREE